MYILIVFLPLIGAITAGLFGRYIGKQGAIFITTGSVGISALMSFIVFYEIVLSHSVCSIKIFP
jgi:NADH-quinone oxidoreductase subunit L